MKKTISRAQWIGITASALMLALFVMHFLPYWRYQGESVSIAGYVIRPYEHSTFTELFRSYFGKKYRINLMFGLPMLLTIVSSLIGSVVCVLCASKRAVFMVPVACGVLGLCGLLAGQPYQLSTMRLPMLILFALTLIVGVIGLAFARAPKKTVVQE